MVLFATMKMGLAGVGLGSFYVYYRLHEQARA